MFARLRRPPSGGRFDRPNGSVRVESGAEGAAFLFAIPRDERRRGQAV
jgi:hypothetical protein